MVVEIFQLPREVFYTLLGGLITLVVSIVTLQINAWILRKQEKKRREFEKAREGVSMLDALIIELKENREILDSIKTKFIKLSASSWETHKGNLNYFDRRVEKQVISIYSKILLYSNLIQDPIAPYDIKKKTRNNIEKEIDTVITELEGSYRAMDKEDARGLFHFKPDDSEEYE